MGNDDLSRKDSDPLKMSIHSSHHSPPKKKRGFSSGMRSNNIDRSDRNAMSRSRYTTKNLTNSSVSTATRKNNQKHKII